MYKMGPVTSIGTAVTPAEAVRRRYPPLPAKPKSTALEHVEVSVDEKIAMSFTLNAVPIPAAAISAVVHTSPYFALSANPCTSGRLMQPDGGGGGA